MSIALKASIVPVVTGYPRYTSQVHTQFRHIINSMNRDIGVTVETSNALFTQVVIIYVDLVGAMTDVIICFYQFSYRQAFRYSKPSLTTYDAIMAMRSVALTQYLDNWNISVKIVNLLGILQSN